MKLFRLLFVVCAAFLTQTFSFSQTPSAGKTTLNYEYALRDPLNARIYTLKNGLKVYLSVYKNQPRIQTMIAVRAGSKNDPADATGLAHYLEHMVFKGSDKFGTRNWEKESAEIKKIENLYEIYRKTTEAGARKKIYRQIDSISGVAAKYAIANEYDKMIAGIGGDNSNAYTSNDNTIYIADIPANQADNWLKIESERFRKLVLRLFHTELEAVYEEKNRNLDSDENKTWEAMMSGLFKKHTYGTQTTIGTIDHLKNPSMVEINKFFDKYYVPNNMAIIMSGDFNPDQMIVLIEKYFGAFKSKPLSPPVFEAEPSLPPRTVKEVLGPDPANVNIAWRVGGHGSKDADVCSLIAEMMYNQIAGVLDLNLNQAQKVLKSNAVYEALNDYGLFGMTGEPKEGQTLEQVEQLLLSQLELFKKGDFPDWLQQAAVTNMKLNYTRSLENNWSRADEMCTAFTAGIKWQHKVDELDRLSKITKQEIMDFARQTFGNNYVVVFKRTGADTTVQKVEKPVITPVQLDRDNISPFMQSVMKSQPAPIEPKFIDYGKDIVKSNPKAGVELLYNKNNENALFELSYLFRFGSNNNRALPLVLEAIPFLATTGSSAGKIKEEFYKLGCAYYARGDGEETSLHLEGLDENFEKAIALLEKIIADPVLDETVLNNLKSDFIKERNDLKLKKDVILDEALLNYALYGKSNPFSNVMSDEELQKFNVADVKREIRALFSTGHSVLYYGPLSSEQLNSSLNTHHKMPAQPAMAPEPVKYEMKPANRDVYLINYDMKQVEILMVSPGMNYNPSMLPVIQLYNTYFGSGMNSVVFQDLRESRALAYSARSRYKIPDRIYKRAFNSSYIGSQADKLGEALKGLNDLLNNMPRSENNFEAAKEGILQDIRTARINRSDILYSYIDAQYLGLNYDIRKDVFEKVKKYTFSDIKKFHEEHIRNKPTNYAVLGKKDELDLKELEKYGKITELDLKEIFGY